MKRLEKLVLEQITRKSKLGDWGIINDKWESINPELRDISKKLVNDESIDVVSFVWWVINEDTSFKIVASNLGQSKQYGKNSQFNTGKFIYVIDEKIDGETRFRKPIEYFPVYIVPVTTSDIPKSTYNIGTSPVVSMQQYMKWKAAADAIAAKEKAAKEKAAKEKAEQQRKAIADMVNGTQKINVNKLGNGTPDAKAFQELLYLVALKLEQTGSIWFKPFVHWRTQGADGGWDGKIGDDTLNMLDKLGLKDQYTKGDKAGVIKEFRNTLKTNESINYFKGTGMNIKLKDLLQEQIKIKSDDEVAGGGGSTTTSTKTTTATTNSSAPKTKATKTTTATTNSSAPKTKATKATDNMTPDTFSANYTGKGKITYKSGNTFEGSWENGIKSGPGTMIYKKGDRYVGEYHNGKKHGQGTYTWASGDKFEGTWKDGEYNGQGTFTKKGAKPVQETWENGARLSASLSEVDIEDLYKKSVATTKDILLKLVNYVNKHDSFAGYTSVDDDEAGAMKDLVKPWVQSNIQPKVLAYYSKYLKPYMDTYNVPRDALNIEYDLEYVGTKNSVTNIPDDKFRKIVQNYLILKANSSNTALDEPYFSGSYYNYAGDKSSYTIPYMFYWNITRSVYYWDLTEGRAFFDVDTNF